MLYMVELRYAQEHRDEALRYFWEHGATHYTGDITLNGAWVATQDRIAYALVDACDQNEIAKACEPLGQFGEISFRHVTSFDQI